MGSTVLNAHPTGKLPGPSESNLEAPQRKEMLDRAIGVKIGDGGHLEHRVGDYEAVIKTGSKPNHVLHLVLTIFTLGLWGIVWLILAFGTHERTSTLSVDEHGMVTQRW
jgi:hypothetical protein